MPESNYSWKSLQRPKLVKITTASGVKTLKGVKSITPTPEAEVSYEKQAGVVQESHWVGNQADTIEIVLTDFSDFNTFKPGVCVGNVHCEISQAFVGNPGGSLTGSVGHMGTEVWQWNAQGVCVVESAQPSISMDSIAEWTLKLKAVLKPDGTETVISSGFTSSPTDVTSS